eukprot:165648-Pelagomonas_calceolata.AAC.2
MHGAPAAAEHPRPAPSPSSASCSGGAAEATQGLATSCPYALACLTLGRLAHCCSPSHHCHCRRRRSHLLRRLPPVAAGAAAACCELRVGPVVEAAPNNAPLRGEAAPPSPSLLRAGTPWEWSCLVVWRLPLPAAPPSAAWEDRPLPSSSVMVVPPPPGAWSLPVKVLEAGWGGCGPSELDAPPPAANGAPTPSCASSKL